MALIKHRPNIRLLVAPEVRPGEEFVATVVVEARREVPIEYLTIELTGTERGTVGSGKYATTREWQVCRMRAVLSEATSLPEGRSEYKCRFAIPDGAPPSYNGVRSGCEYIVAVRASIPWWPDAKRSFEINVGLAGDTAPPGKPAVFSSRPAGPEAREPHIECSLASDVVAAGGVISGAVALGNVAFNRYEGIALSIRGVETVRVSRRVGTSEPRRYEARVATSSPLEEGTPYPFRIRLPGDVPPSFQSRLWKLAWEIEVRAKIAWSTDMRITIPLRVVPRRFREPAPAGRLAPPDVGSERLQKVWAAVAEETALALDGPALRGTMGDVRVEITREHRGRRGIHLVASLSYPSLGLGLSIQPHKLFQWGASGLALDIARFDKEHHITCREYAQLDDLFAPFAPHLTVFRGVTMSDTSARLEARGAGASKTRLRTFVDAALAVARGLARGRDQLAPPAAMVGQVPAWRDLAEDLDGRLSLGDMSVEATVLGMSARVGTLFGGGGAPSGARIDVQVDRTIDEVYRASFGDGDVDAFAALPDDAGGLARRIFADAERLEIAADAIHVTLAGMPADPRRLAGRVRSVAQLAVALVGASGPYR